MAPLFFSRHKRSALAGFVALLLSSCSMERAGGPAPVRHYGMRVEQAAVYAPPPRKVAEFSTSFDARQYEAPQSMPSARRDKIESAALAPPPAAVRRQKPAATSIADSRLPDFSWPVRGKVVSSYGPKAGGLYNDGINIAAPKGTPVASAAEGVVVYVGDRLDSYGNLVLIRHGGGMATAYAHLAAISVVKGALVKKGQVIGTVGSTGTVANAQLHFEVRRGAETLDPKKFLG